MPEPIQSLWIGSELSAIEKLCINSFLAAGHEFRLYTYNKVAGVPAGTTVCDAHSVLPESAIFRSKKGSLALFSDVFRWTLLLEQGGYWTDTDMVCLRPFEFAENCVYGKETSNLVNTAVLRFPAGHPISKLMLERCLHPNRFQDCDSFRARKRKWKRILLRQGVNNAKWGELGGPIGLTMALKHHNLFNTAQPFTTFFPFGSDNWESIVDATFANGLAFFEQSYGIHLWNEMMRRAAFDKNFSGHPDSLLEQLKRRFIA